MFLKHAVRWYRNASQATLPPTLSVQHWSAKNDTWDVAFTFLLDHASSPCTSCGQEVGNSKAD